MILQNTITNKKRLKYAITFIILLTIEVLIALYVHDTFIRPYIGDVLVVIVLYMAFRMFKTDGIRFLPVYIFLFAGLTECLQFFNIVQLLNVEHNTFLRILIGSVFDMKDILCYGIGCILLGIYEWKFKKDVS
ncbi:ribosomal maturation YjgA family protein [Anaeromicropila herbilytica]|uniref:Membrane protein n=1 Tax=Anaeromicropila herbilytica TaxID=2785025 RepID=A0A7R7EMR5_9FIRM|nr:DUF2809 domain-containing protein [Anaeromicropila herbilytica]BCN31674.1 membrane protein [Anaeromicropila herbilytica]